LLRDSRLFDLLNSRVVRRGPKRRDRDGDRQAAVIARTGGGGTTVDCDDGRGDGQAETEALVGGAVWNGWNTLSASAELMSGPVFATLS